MVSAANKQPRALTYFIFSYVNTSHVKWAQVGHSVVFTVLFLFNPSQKHNHGREGRLYIEVPPEPCYIIIFY